ncbi:MAG: DUF3467 domain-containing protein [Phycisphaerales bacterium]
MADPQQGQQQVQIRIDESKMVNVYANTIRTATTSDEMVMDFGLNLPQQQGQGQQPSMVFQIGTRVVMNWAGASASSARSTRPSRATRRPTARSTSAPRR